MLGAFCVSKFFDTLHENLPIFMEEEACGNLKISRFSGRFPDRRYCFSYAFAPEKPSATYTPPRPCVSKFFDTLHENLRIFRAIS